MLEHFHSKMTLNIVFHEIKYFVLTRNQVQKKIRT